MRIKSLILSSLFLILYISCEETRNNSEEKSEKISAEIKVSEIKNPEQSMNAWLKAWDEGNTELLKELTANDAVLLMDGREIRKEELGKWIDSTAGWMKNFRTIAIMGNETPHFAWETGTYTHGDKNNDTLKTKGTYTLIWERKDSRENDFWKVKVMDITPQ